MKKLLLALLLLVVPADVLAAISSSVVFEVRNGGSDSNGGGFRGGAAVSTPSAPTVSNVGTGGSVAANTYYVVVTLTDGNGETSMSAESSTTTTGTTSTITVNSPSDPGVNGTKWSAYIGTTSGGPYWAQGTGLTIGANRSITTTPPTSGTQAPGTDRSQQTGAQVVIDGATINFTSSGATATMTMSGYTPTAADVGNCVTTLTGTNVTVGTFEIIGWSSTTWVLDRNWCSGAVTSGTGNMGGAMATPGKPDSLSWSGGGITYIKYNASAFTMTSSTGAGGKIAGNATTRIIGYNTNRTIWNQDSSRPTIQASSNSFTMIQPYQANQMIRNIICDANGHTGITAFRPSVNPGLVESCKALNVATGFDLVGSGQGAQAENCEANGCTTNGFEMTNPATSAFRCSALAVPNGAYGFHMNQQSCYCNQCVAQGASSSTGTGFFCYLSLITNCVAYGFSGTNGNGVSITGGGGGGASHLRNNVCYSNYTNYNYPTNPVPTTTVVKCAGGNAGAGGQTVNLYAEQLVGFITLTADPFTNASSQNFSLNSTSGGGALLKALGVPSAFPGCTGTSYPDIGAYQSSGASAPVRPPKPWSGLMSADDPAATPALPAALGGGVALAYVLAKLLVHAYRRRRSG